MLTLLLRFSIACELWNSNLNQRFTFFTAVSHLSRPLGKQKLTSAASKGHICRSWLVDFDPFCFFSVSTQGSWAVAIILIVGREKPNRQLGFEIQSSHVIENCNNKSNDKILFSFCSWKFLKTYWENITFNNNSYCY